MPACPLFINLQIVSTREIIHFDREEPLFQVQPITHECYAIRAHQSILRAPALYLNDTVLPMTEEDWRNFRSAIRVDDASETHRMGDYGAEMRRKSKDSSQSLSEPDLE